jgi:DNA-binding MarR family transcriptional regulator
VEERERITREVMKVLPELAKSLNRDTAMHAAARGRPGARPVSVAQVRVLVHLAQYGPQTMGELADGLQIATASATGLVKPLVTGGYVTRTRDAADQRVVHVRLSAPAQVMADQILAERRKEVEAALAGMDDAMCRNFLEALKRLAGRQE